MEGDRAFAQAQDHRVAAGLDALGDGDLALAAQQFDRAHLAQIHTDGIVRALDGFFLLFGNRPVGHRRIGFLDIVVLVVRLDGVLVAFDDVDAHLADRGHDVLDLLG